MDQENKKRLFRRPYVLAAQFYEQFNEEGTPVGQINGGALSPGDERVFPLDPFSNALSRPFIITRVKAFVGRPRIYNEDPPIVEADCCPPFSADEHDGDYNDVLLAMRDLVTNEDVTKEYIPLSVLCDHQRREWLFHPGTLVMRKYGGGARISIQVLTGAPEPKYNVSIALHGYTEEYAEPASGLYPESV